MKTHLTTPYQKDLDNIELLELWHGSQTLAPFFSDRNNIEISVKVLYRAPREHTLLQDLTSYKRPSLSSLDLEQRPN